MIILFGRRPGFATLAKSYVQGYTKKDGTTVKPHENGRQRTASKGSKQKKSADFDHPTVVGKISNHKAIGEGGKEVAGNGDPTNKATTSFDFGGKTYHQTDKTGTSNHDGTPVTAFDHRDSGERVWADAKGRVHADSSTDVDRLRKVGKQPAGPTTKQKIKTNNEGMGFHGSAWHSNHAANFGADNSPTDEQRQQSNKAADDAFHRVANELVDGGHFKTHEHARDYLDSRHGRHLADEIGHEKSSKDVKWLPKSVAQFKKESQSS